MDLHKLHQTVQSQIRSDMMILDISQLIIKLIENAIDADCSCVAVKLNLLNFKIQIVDNGRGIKEEHLNFVGNRYWTTKCRNLRNLNNSVKHDHCGETLANIKNSCSKLLIVTRAEDEDITFCKIFDESKTATVVQALHQRVSKGTTIIINNIFSNLPVRQKRIVPSVEIQNTKRCLQGISLMHPSILFIMKDDATNTEILRIQRTSSTLKTFCALFPLAVPRRSLMIKLVAESDNVSTRALICREPHVNRRLQFVFVNKRYLINSEIQCLLCKLLSEKGFSRGVLKGARVGPSRTRKHPIFIVNIRCPPEECCVTTLPDRRDVEFKNGTNIKQSLITLVDIFWEKLVFNGDVAPKNIAAKGCQQEQKMPVFAPKDIFEKLNDAHTFRGFPATRPLPVIEEKDCESLVDRGRQMLPLSADGYQRVDKVANSATIEEIQVTRASAFTPGTPLFTRLSEKPILSFDNLLAPRSRPQTTDSIAKTSCASFMNTDKLFTKMRSMNEKAREREFSVGIKFSSPLQTCLQAESVTKYLVKTNSNIHLYEVKKKYHLSQQFRNFHKKCMSNYSRKLISEKPVGKIETESCRKRGQPMNDEVHVSKRNTLIKEAVLNVSDTIYDLDPKFSTSEFVFKPTLTISSSGKADLPSFFKKSNPLRSKSANSLMSDAVENLNAIKTKSVNLRDCRPSLETVTQTNIDRLKKVTLTTDDFVCAPKVLPGMRQTSSTRKPNILQFPSLSPEMFVASENCMKVRQTDNWIQNKYETCWKKESSMRRSALQSSSRSKKTDIWIENVLNNDSVSESLKEPPLEVETNEKYWFPGVPSELLQNTSSTRVKHTVTNVNECQVRQCPCDCHKRENKQQVYYSVSSSSTFSISDKTFNESETTISFCFHPPYISPVIMNETFVEEKTAEKDFETDFSHMMASVPICCNSVTKSENENFGSGEEFSRLTDQDLPIVERMEDNDRNKTYSTNLLSEANVGNVDEDTTSVRFETIEKDSQKENISGTASMNQPEENYSFDFCIDRENAFWDNSVDDFPSSRKISTNNSHESSVVNSFSPDEKNEDDNQTGLSGKVDLENYPTNSPSAGPSDVRATKVDEIFLRKMHYKRNSKFLVSLSANDIPRGMLDVQNVKSKSVPFEKIDENDLVRKLMKPCSMKNHLTIDDSGNSCLRIFPLMKKVLFHNDHSTLDYGSILKDENCCVKFSKMDLKLVKFLTQIDRKFLLGSMIKSDTREQIIIMFDQHAVDERIRVERLNKEYVNENGEWRSVSINVPLKVRVSRSELGVIVDFRKNFGEKGLDFLFDELNECTNDQFFVHVIRVPLCLHNRALREDSKKNFISCLKQLTESLIKELINTLITTRGISRHATPNVLQNIINFEACRGAVKFGQQLSADICTTLLQNLWCCDVPFQCAHGRPLLAPLVNIAKLAHIEKRPLCYHVDELKTRLL